MALRSWRSLRVLGDVRAAEAARYGARNADTAASSSSGRLLGDEMAGAGNDERVHVVDDGARGIRDGTEDLLWP